MADGNGWLAKCLTVRCTDHSPERKSACLVEGEAVAAIHSLCGIVFAALVGGCAQTAAPELKHTRSFEHVLADLYTDGKRGVKRNNWEMQGVEQ
jgi:hypothetical protein